MAAHDDRDETIDGFHQAVNMTPAQLKDWLATDESKSVGQSNGAESVGHASGRRIIELLNTNKTDLTDGDLAHMRKVAGYVKRHSAQRPGGDVTDTPWRYSLMNWGHDPKE
ncbi:DUF3140 domain-containing protein [Streptomyces sp. NPDC095817]|uniref:DUF3140 domain-containing protein n=1 Tax=Streptomyces sp. NPDC095817 TaxID=3155082 RepID=UPI00331A113C